MTPGLFSGALVNGVLGMLLLAFMANAGVLKCSTSSQCAGIFFSSSGWLQLGMQVLGEWQSAEVASSVSARIGCSNPLHAEVQVPGKQYYVL